MSFPRYPSYKPSGVQWLGHVPAHWLAMPIRRVARLESGHTPSRNHPEYWVECTIPWFSLADIWQVREAGRDCIYETAEQVSEVGIQNSAARVLPKGTVMLSRTASVGFAAIMGVDMATTQDFANWVCGERMRPKFLLYSFKAMGGEFNRLKMGSTHNTIYMPDIQSLCCAVPPPDEQDLVIAFLDRETAKIDALVAEQEKLIALLKEKRQAVISHAVTKGLNPDAPMKSSGVEWLGDVPEHWRPSRLRTIYRLAKRQNHPDLPVLSVYRDHGVILKDSRDDNINKTPDDLSSYQLVERGDLVVNKMKAWQGSLGVAEVAGITSPDYAVFLPTLAAQSPFMHFLLRCELLVTVYRGISNGIRLDQWRLEPDKFLELNVYLPGDAEQSEIVSALKLALAKMDALTAEAANVAGALRERRAALISAAVTGQIDVRRLN